MYFVDNWQKFFVCIVLIAGYQIGTSYLMQENQVAKTEHSLRQLDEGPAGVSAQTEMRREHFVTSAGYSLGWAAVALLCFFIFLGDIRNMCKKLSANFLIVIVSAALLCSVGCAGRKPFEPVKLEVIESHEVAFMLPLTGDAKKQGQSSNEAYLKANLVYAQQVQIPQQWVQKGYENMSWNGEWRNAAILLKVNTSPVTREWTADPTTGTSNKNEAIWVMTSDQVEFSTGWTITARIANRDDAVLFLHNYPSGTISQIHADTKDAKVKPAESTSVSLTKVMDTEVRSKLQAVFGLEVTDLPMDELRRNATPHILKTVKVVTDYFKERGIQITNLGITGGFVYKDKAILDTMVKVFISEQEKAVAIAGFNAQVERNKAVISKAEGEADAILKTKKAEADGIRMVAEAKAYELEKAGTDKQFYLTLKQMDVEMQRLKTWDGRLPSSYIGNGPMPTLLMPAPIGEKK